MKIAIYPGSFNPFHKGHADILNKALCVFDKVTVAIGVNPEKGYEYNTLDNLRTALEESGFQRDLESNRVDIAAYTNLLVTTVTEQRFDAVIRGLRNGTDLEYERAMQYWNEDLNMAVPTVYFICDRSFTHISSSSIRSLEKFKK